MALGAPSLTSGSGSAYSGGARNRNDPRRYATVTGYGQPIAARQESPLGVVEEMSTDKLAGALGFQSEMPTMELIESAARAPGYIMERPIAAADTIVSGLMQQFGMIDQNQTALESLGQGIRDIPMVGEHIGNGIGLAMGAFNTVTDIAPTLLNARYARIIDGTRDLGDDEPVPWEYSATIPDAWDNISNMGDLREHMREALGWTPELMQQAMSHERGWLDFAWGPKTVANEWGDAAIRMGLDPTNLLIGAGVVLKGVKGANTVMRSIRAGTRMTAAARESTPLVGVAARAAIHKGASAGVTTTGLGYSLVDMSRRFLAGPFATYRKGAIATTAGQVGLQATGTVAESLGLSDTIMGDIGRIGESMAENKPLSENDLYMLAMIFTFPGGKLAKGAGSKLRTAPIIGIDNALWARNESAVLKHMARNDPDFAGKEVAQIRAEIIERFGGIDEYEAFLANVARDAVALKEGLLNLSDNAAVTRRKIDNMPALGFHIQAMQRRAMRKVGKALKEGSLRPQDLTRALDHFALSRGGAMEAMLDGGQAQRRVSVDKLAQTWGAYSKAAKELDAAFEGGAAIVPGISDKVYTVEGLAHIKQLIKDELSDTGKISGEFLQNTLMLQPALVKLLKSPEVQRAFAGAKEVDGQSVLKALSDDKIATGAYTFDDLWGDTMRQWAGGAEKTGSVRQSTGRAQMKLAQGEKLASRYRPEHGTAEVLLETRGYQGARAGGANPVTVGMVREARGLPENAAGTQATLSALQQAGYQVDAATQIVQMDGKAVTVGAAVRAGDLTDIASLEQMAAVMLEGTGGTKATIIQRGKALDIHNLERNAAEFQWDLPARLTEPELNVLMQDVKKAFGDNVIIDDTNGVIRVIIRKDKPDPRLFAHLRAVTEAAGVSPSVERLHVRTVRNGRKPLKKDPNGTRTVKDIASEAKSDPSGVRYRNATESTAAWRRRYVDGVGRADGVVGRRGPDAPSDATGPGGRPLDVGGSGASRTEAGPITRYESLRGNKPIGRRGKYVVEPDAVAADAVAHLGADHAPRPGDIAFRSDDGAFGAYVRDGELRVWRKPGAPGDWDDFLAHVSEYATFVRVPGKRTKRGGRAVYTPDTYAEHGWRPAARVAGRDGDVYLVRDVAGEMAPDVPPIHLGGWQSVRDSIPKMEVQQARITAKAWADNIHGGSQASFRIPEVEALGNQLLEMHTPAEIVDMYRAKSDDPALIYAYNQILDEPVLTADVESFSSVDVPPPTAGRIGEPRTYNMSVTRTTATGKPRSHRRNANEMYSASVKPKRAGKVTNPVSVEVMRDPRSQLLLSDDGKAGALVTADGDLVNVFGEGAQLNDILVEARELAYTASFPKDQTAAMARHGFVVVAESGDTVYAVKRELLGEVTLTDATPQAVVDARTRLSQTKSMADDSFAPQDEMAWRNQEENYWADNHNKYYEPFREGGEQVVETGGRVDYYGPDGNHVGYVYFDEAGKIATVQVRPDYRGKGLGTKMLEYIDANTSRDVVAGIGYGYHSPGGRALMESYLRRLGAEVPDVNVAQVLDPDDAFMVQRGAMMSEGGVVPADLKLADAVTRNFGEGQVLYIQSMEAQIANNFPKLDPSLEGMWEMMSPRQKMKIAQIERELKLTNPTYTLKAAPAGAATYFTGQGAAFRQVVGDWTDSYHGSKRLFDLNTQVADVWDKIMHPVYSAEINRMATNHFFNQMQQFGVDNATSKAVLRDLRQMFDMSPDGPGGNKLLGRMEHLQQKHFQKAFADHLTPEQLAKMKAAGYRPQDVVRQSSGRIKQWFREKAGPTDPVGGNGALGRLESLIYDSKAGRKAQDLGVGLKVVYSIWRFALDPRWYIINRYEADILTAVRSGDRRALGIGFRGRRKGPHARTMGQKDMLLAEQSDMFQAHRRERSFDENAFTDYDESMFAGSMQAGFMDMRALNGYVAVGLEAEGRQRTVAFMREMLEDPSPNGAAVRDLIERFEVDGMTTPEQWAKAFEDMLYDWDNKGIRGVLDDEAAKLNMDTQVYEEVLDMLYERHQQSYLAMQRLTRGNVNRSNLERILNNPFLYWPISYQLKAGKWMYDTLFVRFAGRETGMIGAGALTHWYNKHEQMVENNPEYAQFWKDKASTIMLASQFAPMTPFDMGTYMARWTRYGADWVQGTFDEDLRNKRYPQDVMSFIERSSALGPIYSAGLIGRSLGEWQEDDKKSGSESAFTR